MICNLGTDGSGKIKIDFKELIIGDVIVVKQRYGCFLENEIERLCVVLNNSHSIFKDYGYDKILVDLNGDVIDNFGLYGYIRVNLSDIDKAKLLNTLDKIKHYESIYLKDSRDSKRIKECILEEVLLAGKYLIDYDKLRLGIILKCGLDEILKKKVTNIKDNRIKYYISSYINKKGTYNYCDLLFNDLLCLYSDGCLKYKFKRKLDDKYDMHSELKDISELSLAKTNDNLRTLYTDDTIRKFTGEIVGFNVEFKNTSNIVCYVLDYLRVSNLQSHNHGYYYSQELLVEKELRFKFNGGIPTLREINSILEYIDNNLTIEQCI